MTGSTTQSELSSAVSTLTNSLINLIVVGIQLIASALAGAVNFLKSITSNFGYLLGVLAVILIITTLIFRNFSLRRILSTFTGFIGKIF